MNFVGHKLIASKTCDLLEKEYGIPLDRAAFCFGNILPDASWMKRPVHTMENWGDRVGELIDELQKKEWKSSRLFSIKLGVVCHFVSDFFCLAHNRPYNSRQIDHLLYETRQAKKFVSLRSAEMQSEIPLFTPSDIDAFSLLSGQHSDFVSGEISFEKEFSYSVLVCTALCNILISDGVLAPSHA